MWSLIALSCYFLLCSVVAIYKDKRIGPKDVNIIRASVPKLPLCHNILEEVQNATWKKKFQFTKKIIEERDAKDVILRKHRGQPSNLTRADLRCGTKYPIHAPEFGPDIPAMCSRESDKHCCNAEGRCSNGQNNCTCPQCTDFRKVLNAELYDWVPSNCRIRNYTSEEACTMVNDRLTRLVVIGDSLMRHVYTALMLIFTNDFQKGAILKKDNNNCNGERQFVDRGKANCFKMISTNSKAHGNMFCRGESSFSLVFHEYYCLKYAEKVLAVVEENLNRSNSLIVINIGMHNGLNADLIQAKLVDPILKIIGEHKWPRIVWFTVHAQGFLKPMAYRQIQNNQKITEYNKLMSDKMKNTGIDVFDVFPMTNGVHSYDGTHYGVGLNILKVQYLLNYIHQSIHPRNQENP